MDRLGLRNSIGLHSTGPSVAGTALGRGWYDGTSFAGKKFRRESPAPGISDIGTSFAGGLMSPGLFRRGYDVSGAPFAGDLGRGTSFAGD